MPEHKPSISRVAVVSMLVTLLAFGIAVYSFYNGHRDNCQSRTQTLNVLADVIKIATTPGPTQKLTPQQQAAITAFRDRVDARIDAARCT